MRKRVSRPRRFAAIDNAAIDGLPSVLSVGLLTCLIRAKDGDDVTVETLSDLYDEGEKSLTKAMRALVDDAYVIKLKIQRATTETVIEDGKEVEKRGGSWYTTFTVDSIPFSRQDIAAMVEEIYAEGNVKSHRVEPTRLDPRNAPGEPPRRPAPPKGGVGATRGNAGSEGAEKASEDARPTPPSGAPGRPAPGQGGAHIRNKTFSAHTEHPEDEDDAVSPRSGGDVRRTFTSGSSQAEAEGGVAASSKTSPPDHQHDDDRGPAGGPKSSGKKAKHTREQLAQVAAVRAHFPADFLNGLPDIPALSDAILSALTTEDRTVQQLGERIVYRWDRHGYASKFYAGEIESRVGAAVGMVRALRRGDRFACADPRCENGRSLDSGVECRACEERLADRRSDRRQEKVQEAAGGSNGGAVDALPAMPSPRTSPAAAAPYRECAELMCGRPIAKGSTDTLCRTCREDADEPALVNSSSNPPF